MKAYVLLTVNNFSSKVQNEETLAIKLACQKMHLGYNPKLTVITVQKRHNTRFFRDDAVPAGAKNVVC